MKLITTLLVFITTCFIASQSLARQIWQWNDHGFENIVTVSPIQQNGTTYLAVATNTLEKNLYLFNLNKKEKVWSTEPDDTRYRGGSYGDKNLFFTRDINGDGMKDLVWGTAWGSRSLYTLDFKTGLPIWHFNSHTHPRSPKSGWILSSKELADTNGDGIPEIVFSVGKDNSGIYLADGKSGQILWYYGDTYDSPNVVSSINDVNGDGIADVLVGFAHYDTRIMAISGKNGVPIWQVETRDSIQDIQTINDMDGDGINDLLLIDWSNRIRCFSGVSGKIQWEKTFGHYMMKIRAMADLNGDGVEEFVISQTGNQVAAFSGRDGADLWKVDVGGAAWTIDLINDLDQDGHRDVITGGFDGRIHALSSKTGEVQWVHSLSEAKVFTVRSVPDINGDGFEDVAAGTQYLVNEDLKGAGTLFLIDGRK